MKVLIEHYVTYGKSEDDELRGNYTIEDSIENREGVVEECTGMYCDFYGSVYDFVDGQNDFLSWSSDGGDWDDPTGGYLKAYSYESKLEELQKQFDRGLERLNKQFGIEE